MPPSTHQRAFSQNDTLESLSALLTRLYTLHLLLPSSSLSNLQISQPPHSPSASLLFAWQTVGMSNSVIETLKRLPFLSGEGSREIAPDTLALDYLDEDGNAVDVWRDPFCLTATKTKKEEEGGEVKAKQQGYLKNAIPLTSCIGVDGCLLLLDLDSNHIYEIKDQHLSPPHRQPPPVAAPHYYKHYPHKPALQVLQQYIDNTKKLLSVYDPATNIWLQNHDDYDWENKGEYNALKQLYVECGWPERFDGEEFMEKYAILGRSRGWDD